MNPSSDRLLVLLSLAMFSVFGMALTLTGTLLPRLETYFQIGYGHAATLAVSASFGYLVAVMVTGWLVAHVEGRSLVLSALALSCVGYALFGVTSSFWLACWLMVVGGVGGGTIEVVMNSVVMQLNAARRGNLLNFIHIPFGLGAFAAPALIGKLLSVGVSWKWFYLASGFLWAVLLLLTVPSRFPSIKPASAEGTAGEVRALHFPVARILFLVIGIYVGLELGVGAWITMYLEKVGELTPAHAAYFASAFWLGLAAGRLVLGIIGHRWHESAIVIALTLWAILCLSGALVLTDAWMAAISLALVGTGFSGIYPTVVSWGGGAYPKHVAQVTALIATGGGIGAVLFPWLMGHVSDRWGLTNGMRFYVVLAFVMLGLMLWARNAHGRTAPAKTSVEENEPVGEGIR